jgi:hypothetical protein
MDENQVDPAADNKEPNADQRIADLEARLADTQRRYAASSEEGKRLAQLNQQFQQQAFESRQTVPQRSPSPYQSLIDSGVDAAAIDAIVDERVNTKIAAAFEPIAKGFQARTQMLASYPEYGKYEADIAAFVQSDPTVNERYQRIFSSDPIAANEYAYLKYGETTKRSHKNGTQREAREETAHAQIPSGRSGDARRQPQGNEAALHEARRAVIESGYNKGAVNNFARQRLRQVITDEFLNQ